MGKKREGGYLGGTPSSWSASVRPGMWSMRSQFELNKDGTWPEPPPELAFLSRSLRFNSADSAFLNRTFASAGNRRTWTWAGWVKRGALGSLQKVFGAGSDFTNAGITYIEFDSSDRLGFFTYALNSGGYIWQKYTTQVFRDPSAWYHIHVVCDTNNATAADRARLFVNGVRVSAFAASTDPSSGYQSQVNNSTQAHYFSGYGLSDQFFSGYLTDIHFVDGQALDPTSFGLFDTNGIWQPITYTGSYGTNGFHLDFADNSAATATTLGKDTSGNGNNWTPNNLSITAGAGNDSLVDVPVNGSEVDTGVGSEVRGNYCTWNPLSGAVSLSNGNLDSTSTSALQYPSILGTIAFPSSGKYYYEVTLGAFSGTFYNSAPGVISINSSSLSASLGCNSSSGEKGIYKNGTRVQDLAAWVQGDVAGIAFNADAGTVQFYRNGSTYGTAVTLDASIYIPFISVLNQNINQQPVQVANFGQRPFAYTAPSGFKALNTANLPAPTIVKPSTVMDVALYTGNSSTQTITGLGFSPDLVWVKGRVGTLNHVLADTVRGANLKLASNTTGAEAGTDNGTVSAFNSDGFTVAMGGGAYPGYETNLSGYSYAGWCWDAGSSTVTNTAGSISSQVRANASAGFSIVSWTGNATNGATVGHGLGVKPHLVIYKNRTDADNWPVLSDVLLGSDGYLYLNSTAAKATAPQIAAPTSSVLTLPSYNDANGNGDAMIAYCFAPVAGYSAFGSYTGNGSTDGPFVYTGFRPRWVMLKASSYSTASTDWFLWDAARDTYNVVSNYLTANRSSAEGVVSYFDILSNGFKLRYVDANNNANGQTYIYAAFAESPFQYARAR